MALTRDDLLTANEFHDESIPCDGSRSNRWRRNGKTKQWKRTPDRLEVPVKFGMYDYATITAWVADYYHTAEKCPHLIQIILTAEEVETVMDIMDEQAAK